MSNYEYESPHQDDYASDSERVREDEYLLHLDVRERVRLDRLAEHVTPDPRPEKRVTKQQSRRLGYRELAPLFREAVFERDQGCYFGNPAECSGPETLEVHHVVYEQLLRRDRRIAEMTDRRIGMCCCRRHHTAHHNHTRPILLEEIPAECVAFAIELGYGDWIEQRYPSRQETAA